MLHVFLQHNWQHALWHTYNTVIALYTLPMEYSIPSYNRELRLLPSIYQHETLYLRLSSVARVHGGDLHLGWQAGRQVQTLTCRTDTMLSRLNGINNTINI